MTKQELYNYIAYQSQTNPYANYLSRQFDRLDPEKQDYFTRHIASSELDPKTMMKLAEILGAGKNPATLIGMNYSDIVRVDLNQLPDYVSRTEKEEDMKRYEPEQTRHFQKSQKTPSQRVQDVIDTYIKGNCENKYFKQVTTVDKFSPRQGWKFHISADNIHDYARLVETLVPELVANNCLFKVVKPEEVDKFLIDPQQSGKLITIYPGPGFDFSKLSPAAQNILNEDIQMRVSGDINLNGRINARYGIFEKSRVRNEQGISINYVSSPDGKIYYDGKYFNKPYPDFMENQPYEISKESIMNFYSDSYNKFQQTGDFKTYLQETYTMTNCDGRSHAYVALEIDQTDLPGVIKTLSERDTKNSLSFVANLDVLPTVNSSNCILMVHKSEFYEHYDLSRTPEHEKTILDGLREKGILFERPGWDKQQVAYIIPEACLNRINESAQYFENDGSPAMFVGRTESGTPYIQFDTIYCDDYENMLTEHGISFIEYTTELELESAKYINTMNYVGSVGKHFIDDVKCAIERGEFDTFAQEAENENDSYSFCIE